jgi:hypothetical protein
MKQNNGKLLAELVFIVFVFKMDGFESGVSIMNVEADHMLILHREEEMELDRASAFQPD